MRKKKNLGKVRIGAILERICEREAVANVMELAIQPTKDVFLLLLLTLILPQRRKKP